ncbi:hypothetical protein [Chitinolyticbacter albus]|uniref:hypothetical protein n=1 Tax=Chitinolyticbacter albus TaxID=2961951 RepID=UPI00210DB7E9|nr:hypothetical protein [Chitinolyticbacter albus]
MYSAFPGRPWALILIASLLSGCSITERFLSSEEKIHRAFPPSAEVRVALEDVRETFMNESDTLKALEARVASQIRLRSLTCTQGLSIGRLDSVETIKALPVKQECLAEQDEILAGTVGTFRLGHMLTLPPLRPLASLGSASAISMAGGLNATSFEAASQANVLLVFGSRLGEFASVEIPSGKPLAKMSNLQGAALQHASISPNGRLAAFNIDNSGVVFLDMERGKKLWETRSFTQFYGWLPDVGAALVQDEKSNSPALLDFETGRMEAYTSAPRNLRWIVPTAEKGTAWLGSAREAFQVQHLRAKDGVQATATKNFRLSRTEISSGHPPTLMNQGKTLFFVSNRDFASLNLETGQETAWDVAGFLANRYAKLSETTLLVDSYATNNGVDLKAWVLDLTSRTLAPVDASAPAAASKGQLMGLPGRTGWIRRGYQTTYLGNAAPAGAPQSLSELASAFTLEQELVKLERMEQQTQWAKLDAQVKEDILAAQARAQSLMQRSRVGSEIGAPEAPAARIAARPQAGLPPNAQVEAVGVYQGTNISGETASNGRKLGSVDVRVRRSSSPIILVLSSYEPVQWNLSVDAGTQLAGVLLSGYYPSRVTGAGSARVLQIGRRYAYERGSAEYNTLDREVQLWTGGQSIRVFQGRYEGGAYTVGG